MKYLWTTLLPLCCLGAGPEAESFFSSREWGHDYLRQVSPEGIWYADANKMWQNDSALCWAGVTANLLVWGGWAHYVESQGLAEFPHAEDSVMDYYQQCWGDVGFRADQGFLWFTDGSSYSQAPQGGKLLAGRLNARELVLAYAFKEHPPEIEFMLLKAFFQAGFGVSMSVHSGATLHEITLWGYEDRGDEGFFIYFSNTDDCNGGKPYGARENGPKQLTRTQLVFDAEKGEYYLMDRAFRANQLRLFRQFDKYLIGEPETPDDARPLEYDQVRYGRIDGADDIDWYRIDAAPGDSVAVSAALLKPDHTMRLQASVYDESGKSLYASQWATDEIAPPPFKADGPLHIAISGRLSVSDDMLSDVYTVTVRQSAPAK